MPALLLLLLSADPAYAADVRAACESASAAPEDAEPAERDRVLAAAVDDKLKTDAFKAVWAATAFGTPAAKAARLRAEALKVGLAKCPLADLWDPPGDKAAQQALPGAGKLPKDAVKDAAKAHQDGVASCFEQAKRAAKKKPKGKVTVVFIVGADGGVESVEVDPKETSGASPQLSTCLAGQVGTWKLATPEGGSVKTKWTFVAPK